MSLPRSFYRPYLTAISKLLEIGFWLPPLVLGDQEYFVDDVLHEIQNIIEKQTNS